MGKIADVQEVTLEKLVPYARNAKIHGSGQIEKLKSSIEEFGFLTPCLIDRDFNIIAGHGRVMAAKELGMSSVPCVFIEGLTEAQRRAYILADNRLGELGEWDMDLVFSELEELKEMDFDIELTGFDLPEDAVNREQRNESLVDRFIIPPFSILDTRQGYWQDRKRAWKNIGIKSEEGRDENLSNAPDVLDYMHTSLKGVAVQTSVFDPVLAEVMYKWFCTDGGQIYDCFAGGSVRGIVAEYLGYRYTGIDLRQEQIDANEKQALEIGVSPHWICDDSLNADAYIEDDSCDMLFTCPPYADLEKYSDDERDISNMEYDDFCKVYREILSIACKKLKDNRFAVVVIGDVRDKKGAYRQLVDYTRKVLTDNGLMLYNDLILAEMIGTGAIRAPRMFNTLRKTIKVHQNVVVFYKGDIQAIKDNFTELHIDEVE